MNTYIIYIAKVKNHFDNYPILFLILYLASIFQHNDHRIITTKQIIAKLFYRVLNFLYWMLSK